MFVTEFFPSLPTHAQQGSTVTPFLQYLCVQILPHVSSLTEEQSRHDVLQLLAEGCLYEMEDTCAQNCIEPVFNLLLVSLFVLSNVFFPLSSQFPPPPLPLLCLSIQTDTV